METQTVGHTPGPWRVEGETRIEYGPYVAGDGWCVARILRHVPVEQWKANARLIAVAPDLVAALKKATSAIIVAQAHGFDCDGLLEEVEAALAKAEPEGE